MGESTPICRCRVLYLGSAVPRQSKDGLQGIQEPLRSLYPSEGAIGAKGIDSWLSVWSNGILLENVDENGKQVTRFFPIESLHYCAAVRQVLIPERGNTNPEPKFLPLDSPFARTPKSQHPPIFAAILRRTTGIKVLECHVFICKREAAANALVRCCFHAYADNSYAKQLESGSSTGTGGNMYGTLGRGRKSNDDLSNDWRLRNESTTTLSSVGKHSISHPLNGSTGPNSAIINNGSIAGGGGYTFIKALYSSTTDLHAVDDDDGSICNGAENHKVWNGSHSQIDVIGRESPYEVFPGGVSTLERPAKARQISAPVPIPSPPFKEETKKKKNKKLTKHSGSQSLSGTLVRPKPIHVESLQRPSIHHMPPPPPHGNIMYHSPVSQIPWQCHTFNHHRPVFSNGNMSAGRHHHVSSPQIAPPPPMPAIIPAQYATLQSGRTSKKKKQDRLSSIPVGVPLPPPMFTYMPPPSGSQTMLPTLILSNKKLAQSVGGGLDDSTNSGGESPGATGIYKRKGHLNERAFSYSIRQEHRSRSHGSLASLQFNSPDMKKEQEIAQMMSGLDLNDEPMLNQEKRYMASTSSYLPVETFGRVRR